MGVWIVQDTKFGSLLLLLASFALFYAYMALIKGGMKIKARTFPAVAAIPEAIGRAAEMGRPVYYSTGFGQATLNNQLNGPQTLAGISILSYTTRLCAKGGVKLTYFTPIADSLPLVEETMRTAYLAEGKPEEFDAATMINYQNEQSPYLTASLGWIAREKPAASLLLGGFYYESVVIGEAANGVGAMQIGGSANTHQLPFLVAVCDYTLIMEELYAASAQISGNPDVLGSLKGEDILKFLVLILTAGGFLLALANSSALVDILKV